MEYNVTLEKILWDNFALLREAEQFFRKNLPKSGMELYLLVDKNYTKLLKSNYKSATFDAFETFKEYVFEKYIDKHTALRRER